MPIRRKAPDAGRFDETELALLGRVFDKLKLEQRSPDTLDSIASRIIANYMACIKDEAELVSLSLRR
ncbi:hypothetical protein FJV83_28530 [Mesorhizobium sp. WSM4307]|uniref:hypothetical protein n=1 Tax=unclassified Mesorhizobium TaxID=325217 RepID=UPI000BB04112|nr:MULTISPECIES: hypothetical protein [unclassified Mesorhizobium]PBC18675.1 hypothetical protein CK226_33460 [Mesorhizobium sp. WSM4311]TRC70980.1 hypothetical protein FJV80_33980 [Mesorhizobium sp. WSM4310]TRC78049.1 hypothetical protein FJV81_10775 [Mesorhizobium sp. WSM4315]TRC79238.1 hypothetical protein FJV83_28530 [Mesorhizobium sp. WSM4307]TRC92655.1 hypothetical protein FJV82_32140 [Mesorhizobium sp. WSM4305]